MYFLRQSFLHFASLFCTILFVNAATTPKKPSAVLPLRAAAYGTTFSVMLEIGGQSYPVLADTGSSDLWLLDPGWKCYFGSPTTQGTEVPQSKCRAGNETYTKSSTYSPITSAWLGEHYGAGNDIGTLGYEHVMVGDISIPRQEMGFVNATNSQSDGYGVGIMGLGYPVIASIHPENYTAYTSLGLLGDRLLYETLTTSLVKAGMEPYFAFAINSTPLQQELGDGGYLSFGTLPPVSHGDWVTALVEVTKAIPSSFTNGTGKISEWTLTIEAVEWEGQTNNTPFQAIVDSGNWMNVFPEPLATKINAQFDPPAGDFDKLSGYYQVRCDATPPSDLGVQINGKKISVNSKDMIWRDFNGNCYSSVGTLLPSQLGISLYFLGDVFLKSVVAVFDFGKNEMRFAPRLDSNATSTVPVSSGVAASSGVSALFIVVALVSVLFV